MALIWLLLTIISRGQQIQIRIALQPIDSELDQLDGNQNEAPQQAEYDQGHVEYNFW